MVKQSNKSRTYLLPLIAPLIGIEKNFYSLIDNTYLCDNEDKYKDCFFIIQDFSFKNPEFTAYEHRLTNNDLFVELIDINGQVIYIFNYPKEYLPEYYAFKEGKYSEFGDDAKRQILGFWTEIKGKSLGGPSFVLDIKQILYKEKLLKDKIEKELNVILEPNAELGSFVDIERETINLNEFKKI